MDLVIMEENARAYLRQRWNYFRPLSALVDESTYIKRNLTFVLRNIRENPNYLEEMCLKFDL